MRELRSKQKLVKADANWPNISLSVIRVSSNNFRCHVQGRSKHCFCEIGSEKFWKPEICDFYLSIMHQNILRLEVSMHDFMLYNCFESVEHLEKNLYCFLFVKGFLFRQVRHKIPLIAIFENQVKIVFCFPKIIELDNVLIVTCPQNVDFVLHQLQVFTWVIILLPLMLDLFIVFIATSRHRCVSKPLKTSPNCPEPINSPKR